MHLRLVSIGALIVGLVAATSDAQGPEIRFFPIRSAPLGSAPDHVGTPVTSTFNPVLGCWEVNVSEGVEVDIALQGSGWSLAPGSPMLGAIQGTVDPSGYSNSIGGDLVPKGWPNDPYWGAYITKWACSDNGDPCSLPFDGTCAGGANGNCQEDPDYVLPPCAFGTPGHAVPTLYFAWAVAAQALCAENFGEPKSFGGLILEVPANAAGTYLIDLSPEPYSTFMTDGQGDPIPNVAMTPACITIGNSACCVDGNGDGIGESCHDGTTAGSCAADGGTFLGQDSTCSGATGACILDTNGDGFDDTCAIANQSCCNAPTGTFRGDGTNCDNVGACCLDGSGNQILEDLCADIDLASCNTQGGSFQGVGTSCLGDANGNGTDDACDNEIPAVSEWGLTVLALSLLVAIKIYFGRWRPLAQRA